MSAHEDSLIFSKSLALIEKTKRRVRQIDGSDFPTSSSEIARSLLLDSLATLGTPTLWPAMSPEALYNALIHVQELLEELEASTSDHILILTSIVEPLRMRSWPI